MSNRLSILVSCTLSAVIAIASFCGLKQARTEITKSEQRFSKAVVEEVSGEYNMVTFLDEGGDLWVAEVDSTDGFVEGDKYILTFDDMGTSDPYDDELIDIF